MECGLTYHKLERTWKETVVALFEVQSCTGLVELKEATTPPSPTRPERIAHFLVEIRTWVFPDMQH